MNIDNSPYWGDDDGCPHPPPTGIQRPRDDGRPWNCLTVSTILQHHHVLVRVETRALAPRGQLFSTAKWQASMTGHLVVFLQHRGRVKLTCRYRPSRRLVSSRLMILLEKVCGQAACFEPRTPNKVFLIAPSTRAQAHLHCPCLEFHITLPERSQVEYPYSRST